MPFIQDNVPQNLQRLAGYLIILLLAGLMLSSFAFAYSHFAAGKNVRDDVPRHLNVSGEGKVAVKPDIAVFTAGVVTSSRQVKDAQERNSRASSDVIDFLKGVGVEERDIKTAYYTINPQYQYDNTPCYSFPCPPRRPPQIVSYEVRHSIEVKVRDLGKVDALLSGVVEKGANEVGSVSFRVDEQEKVIAEARKKAIEDARQKADVLARDLGVRVVRIVSFSESGGFPPPYARSMEAFGMGGDDFAPMPQIQPGEQEIRSFVTVVYEFR